MFEQFRAIANLEINSRNSSSDTESTSDGEMSGVDPLDSWNKVVNRPTYNFMAQGL
jgi:hypothetical protein